MKKIYVFENRVMNGTVTMQVEVVAAATRELAEKIRAACTEESKKVQPYPFRLWHSDVKGIPVYETEDEINKQNEPQQ